MSAELSYAKGPAEPPLLEETIGANLDRTVREYGDNEALVECWTGRRWTYTQLAADIDRLARALMAAGIARGDRVGIWSPNSAEWVLVQYATARIGAILVNVNPAYRTHELSYALNQSGLRLLVSAASFKTSDSGSWGNRKSLTTTRIERRRNGRCPSSSAPDTDAHASRVSSSSTRPSGRGAVAPVVMTRVSATVCVQAIASSAAVWANDVCLRSVTAIDRLTSRTRSMRGATSCL